MEIKGIEFRDLPLYDLEFAFNANEVMVSCGHYNKASKDFEPIKIYFSGVKNVAAKNLEVDDFTRLKIENLEIEESPEMNEAHFVFSIITVRQN